MKRKTSKLKHLRKQVESFRNHYIFRYKIYQVIKNYKGDQFTKPFKKYEFIIGRKFMDKIVYHTKYNIHMIPKEYVKEYKKGGVSHERHDKRKK